MLTDHTVSTVSRYPARRRNEIRATFGWPQFFQGPYGCQSKSTNTTVDSAMKSYHPTTVGICKLEL
jgi:hypothetical protein